MHSFFVMHNFPQKLKVKEICLNYYMWGTEFQNLYSIRGNMSHCHPRWLQKIRGYALKFNLYRRAHTKGNDDSTRTVDVLLLPAYSVSSYGALHNLLLSFYTSSTKCQLTTQKAVHLHVLKETWKSRRLPRRSYFWRCPPVCPKKSQSPLWKMWIYFTQDSEAARPLESIKLEELHFTLHFTSILCCT